MRKYLLAVIGGLILTLGLTLSPPALAGDDVEERTGTSATQTDNVNEGAGGDTQTGGSMTSIWAECRSRRINMYMTRNTYSWYDFLYSIVGPVGERQIYQSEIAWYRYCPNGIHPDKVKFLSWRYCHIHLPEGQVEPFRGVGYSSYVTDSVNTWEGPPLDDESKRLVAERTEDGNGPGSGGASCADYIVPGEDRKWFRVRRLGQFTLKYTTATQAIVDGYGDTVEMITENGQSVKTLKPKDGITVGSWYGGGGTGSDISLPPQPLPPGIGVPAPFPPSEEPPPPTDPPSPVCPPDAPTGCP